MKPVSLLLLAGCFGLAVQSSDQGCHPDRLAVYKVLFTTYWDRERFPRQYPEWRPPAHWSKLIGKIARTVKCFFR